MQETNRQFYERYFLEQNFSAEEKLKQYAKVRTLDRFIKSINMDGFGIIVGVGKGAELTIVPPKAVALDLPFTYLPFVKGEFPQSLVLQGDGTILPFCEGTFDWIMCSEVIEHVPDRQAMICEFARVLKPNGFLILTTPNWISIYGLARFLAEFLIKKPVHAGDQPVDKWVTPWGLKKELSSHFKVRKSRGWWFFPPIGRGKFQLFPSFFALLWRILMPIERLKQVIFPWFGHSIFFAAFPKK